MSNTDYDRMKERLNKLYGGRKGKTTYEKLLRIIERYEPELTQQTRGLSEKDVVIITYGDAFREEGTPHLRTLHGFLKDHLHDMVSIVHILPFFPYSSDDGFSVIDYKKVDPKLGSWDDIGSMEKDFKLMFDAVINHISVKSEPFMGFLAGDPRYQGFFIEPGPEYDISSVFRPRALPLITRYNTDEGEVGLWTTFSVDQADLNYENPEVLLYIIDVLLFYASKGASIIRLDAIAFLWKTSGTSCLHLPQTHEVIKLFRNVMNAAAPQLKIITETNVPHRDNVAYFGSGRDEAHMVYNFALPPLAAHALITGNGSYLTSWAAKLETPGENTAFYNFTASHDGIGLMPVKNILPPEEISVLENAAVRHGGLTGLKNNPDGTKSVYELNISYFDLLSDPGGNEDIPLQASRFIASQGIALTLRGVPALYYHSFIGSRNDLDGVERTGTNRSINREKLDVHEVEEGLRDPGSLRSLVYDGLKKLTRARSSRDAFSPYGGQEVLNISNEIFAVLRTSPDGLNKILSYINVSNSEVFVKPPAAGMRDIITGRRFGEEIGVKPYEVLWLEEK